MAIYFRDELIQELLDTLVEERSFLNRVHALYYLLAKEYPENKYLRIKLDYLNEKMSKMEAHSIFILPNLKKRIMKMMLSGCDFETIYIFYINSLKLKNTYNSKGWKEFEKLTKKQIKIVYNYVQDHKIRSFTEFKRIITENKKLKSISAPFLDENMDYEYERKKLKERKNGKK